MNKFTETNLTPVKSELVDAPYVGEFPMVLECKLIHHHEIGLHTHFIGEILDVKIEESLLTDDGKVDVERIRPLIFSPVLRDYHGIGEFLGKAFQVGKKA